jgi:hypothetical protein
MWEILYFTLITVVFIVVIFLIIAITSTFIICVLMGISKIIEIGETLCGKL